MLEKIYTIIHDHCVQDIPEKNTAPFISTVLQISRNEVAIKLNELFENQRLIKLNTRPVCYLDKQWAEKKYHIKIEKLVYKNMEELEGFCIKAPNDFDKLIGHDGSLSDLVKQCKATIAYPPKGLPILLYGPTGTGKSLIAKLAYEYARNQNLLKDDGKFVAVNCSEYANNPELLTANLFGYAKGAFTGAEKDRAGLIKIADGGVLFLDEVHNLKAECQEKLFQFMDQAIYHRVGDNETWYTSDVRLIFATTEKPEEVLLKTLQRRIPMKITVPSLKERGVQEKVQLLYHMFKEEEKRLDKKIRISSKVYNILVTHNFMGNIGGLKSCIQSCCIDALFQIDENGEMLISLSNLPKHLLDNISEKNNVYTSTKEYIYVDDLQDFINTNKKIITLNDELMKHYISYKEKKHSEGQFIEKSKQAVWDYFDTIHLNEQEEQKKDFYQSGIKHILELVAGQYGLEITNNDVLSLCTYLNAYRKDYPSFYNWSCKNEENIVGFLEVMHEKFYKEVTIVQEICKYLTSYLDIDMLPMSIITFILYLKSKAKKESERKKAAVIVAHGFSTASSIADAANKFLGTYVFDAIDMPLHVDTASILQQLNLYVKKIGKIEELLLLVDMGSLEELYKGICLENANIGIINNISTKAALEIGNGILQNKSMEEIFKNVLEYHTMNYHIEYNRQKEKVILCSCASGMGTAEKLKQIIQDSLPIGVDIKVKTYNYNDLLEKGKSSVFFDEYHVICVIGTLNPNIERLNFIPIEGFIINDSFIDLDGFLGEYMNEEQLEYLKKNILKNFTLSNIMNTLTILNPNKLLEHVADAIDRLQVEMRVKLSNHTCFGLYVHISCLIERLVMQREIEVYKDLEIFKEEKKDFIHCVETSFQDVQEFYGVKIPVAEIGYIYDYIKNDYSIAEM